MNKSSFFIVGKHPVIEALKNKRRKVLRVFLTEESKKTIHRENQKKNLLDDIKVYFKTKKELDKYTKEQITDGLLNSLYYNLTSTNFTGGKNIDSSFFSSTLSAGEFNQNLGYLTMVASTFGTFKDLLPLEILA